MQMGESGTIDIMRFITRLGDGLIITVMALLAGGYFRFRSRYDRVVILVQGSGVGSVLMFGMKELFGRARPGNQV